MHNQIQDRAYALWEAAGRPDGQDQRFWFAAAEELVRTVKPAPTSKSSATKKPAAAKPRTARAKKAA
jgi:hypothetical protein